MSSFDLILTQIKHKFLSSEVNLMSEVGRIPGRIPETIRSNIF